MSGETLEQAVEVRDLTVKFGDFRAVDRITFNVPRGEIFGFLGANGAGKTTTIRVLCGLLRPTEGYVRIAGKSFEDGEMAIKAKVGYMSQRFTLYTDLTVGDNLDFTASLRKIPREEYGARKKELFDFIEFDRPESTLVSDLPGGTKQQVSLAAALLHDPDIVFLDEPTAGVTPASRSRFWSLIRRLSQQGKTVFVTTHYMDEAEQCGRIALMRTGQLIALDTPSGLKKSAFPGQVFEFVPRARLSYMQISALQRERLFSFFEPYGLRFHAAIRDESLWQSRRPELEKSFIINRIQPSLEDVFIRKVEGQAP